MEKFTKEQIEEYINKVVIKYSEKGKSNNDVISVSKLLEEVRKID